MKNHTEQCDSDCLTDLVDIVVQMCLINSIRGDETKHAEKYEWTVNIATVFMVIVTQTLTHALTILYWLVFFFGHC